MKYLVELVFRIGFFGLPLALTFFLRFLRLIGRCALRAASSRASLVSQGGCATQ
jgi:hypothetical protein